MENCGNPSQPGRGLGRGWEACSACSGDYQDPDRTAWVSDDELDDEPDDEPHDPGEEFTDGDVREAQGR